MYKVLNIEGKDYKLEYTMEAALFGECVEMVTKILEGFAEVSSGINDSSNIAPDEALNEVKERLNGFIGTISNIPSKTVSIFYAGLLEHHGTHPLGDGLVPNKQVAKALLFKFMQEHKGQEEGDFLGILNMILGQMEEDGFFEFTGLNKVFQAPAKKTKQPQDHKKKTTKTLEN